MLPEEFGVKVFIPTSNTELDDKLTLSEYYIWLGCVQLLTELQIER